MQHILQIEVLATSSCFRNKKKQLRDIQYNDDNEMLTALEQSIDSLNKEGFKNCFEDWLIRMHKSIDAEWQYFEKINKNHPLNTYPKGL